MATYNIGPVAQANKGLPWIGDNRLSVLEFNVDLSKRTGTSPAAGYVSGDILLLGEVLAGFQVFGGALVPQVVEGAAATVAVGDVTAGTAFLAATSINALTPVVFSTATKFYAANDTLKVTLGGTLSGAGVGRFSVCFLVADLSARGNFSL